MKVLISPDFQKLAGAFDKAAQETKEAVRLQVEMSTRDIRDYAAGHHRFITGSGNTEKSILSKTEGNLGQVWLGSKVAVYLHEGTKPHDIVPRMKKILRFPGKSGLVFTRRVHHPGTSPDQFLYEAAEALTPDIQHRFVRVLDDILGGL